VKKKRELIATFTRRFLSENLNQVGVLFSNSISKKARGRFWRSGGGGSHSSLEDSRDD